MAIVQNLYTGDGSTDLFPFSFPYLDQAHVLVEVNGVGTTAFTFANANTIQFNVAPANGASIRIFRSTDIDNPEAVFFAGSPIRASDLNQNNTQLIYSAQETNQGTADANATAASAVVTANGAVATANAADAKADQAIIDSAAAVVTANTAESNSLAAVSTANTASSNASAAVITANAASSAASAAVSTANAASSTANQAAIDAAAAVVTANQADANASAAVITANAADANASAAVITANAADANASAAVITANTAESNSLSAISTANAASAAVAAAVIYQPVVDLAALALLTPADGEFFELQDSTGADTDPSITGIPVGLIGSAGLTFRLRYDDPPGEYVFLGYFANDSETRYLKVGAGQIVDADVNASAAIGLSKLATGALPTGITVASANIVDGTIVDADINASAAIADTKLATISTAGKVSNSATTATSSNTASAIVARDASGDFSAGTITASLTGAASSNVLKAGDTMTGDLTVPSLNGGPLAGTRNRIINGDMRIDQRNAGASVNQNTSGIYTVDRWLAYGTVTSKFTVQRSTTAPASFNNSALLTSSSAYSVTSSDQFVFYQAVEGFNSADFAWGTANASTVAFSFWVRSSLTGTMGGSARNGAFNRSYPFSFTVSSADTWEKKTITIPGDTSGTWSTDNSAGLLIGFCLGAGSSLLTTSGAWTAGNYVGPTGSTSVVATNGATFYITGVQLEPGTVATPFERRSYGQELALCQRYYQKSYRPADAPGTVTFEGIEWMNGANARLANTTRFAVQMRTAPGIVPYDQAGTANRVRTSAGDDQTGYSVRGPSENNFTIDYVSGGVTEILYHWTASAEL
jgi:hypothetical protein